MSLITHGKDILAARGVMPIYEYECPKCGCFEVLQSTSEKPLVACPSCEKKGKKVKVTRLVSPTSFHLKGSGWYKTDYASSGSAKSGGGNGHSSSKPETPKKETAASKDGGTKAAATVTSTSS